METLYRKEQILKAFKEGKTIQSRDGNEWKDFIPQNQIDKPNLDYRGIDNWRIKGETINSGNTETLANPLKQIEKLEADKAELLEVVRESFRVFEAMDLQKDFRKTLKSLIKKHKQ